MAKKKVSSKARRAAARGILKSKSPRVRGLKKWARRVLGS